MCMLFCVEGLVFRAIGLQVLNELEIPHIYHNVARNSPKRKDMCKKWDTEFQVPYMEVRPAFTLQASRSKKFKEV